MNYKLIALLLALATLGTVWNGWRIGSPVKFQVDILNVGEGDAILITSPERVRVLVDGGPGDTVVSQLDKVLPFFDRRVDVVISTHPDADHLSGLIPILQKYKVQMVLRTNETKDSETWKTFNHLIVDKNIQDPKLFMGDSLQVSDGVRFQALWPPEGQASSTPSNETGIVGKLTFGQSSFLLTADADGSAEREILKYLKPEELKAQVLKLPHHGSKNGGSAEFLAEVQPKVALISVGANNSYGHPAQEILERLKAVGAQIFRTDLNGRIDLSMQDPGLVVTPER